MEILQCLRCERTDKIEKHHILEPHHPDFIHRPDLVVPLCHRHHMGVEADRRRERRKRIAIGLISEEDYHEDCLIKFVFSVFPDFPNTISAHFKNK